MKFICPYCGQRALYYGGDVAICSSGVRLSPVDIPPEIYMTVESFRTRMRRAAEIKQQVFPAGAGVLVEGAQSVYSPSNTIPHLIQLGLIRRRGE